MFTRLFKKSLFVDRLENKPSSPCKFYDILFIVFKVPVRPVSNGRDLFVAEHKLKKTSTQHRKRNHGFTKKRPSL